MYLTKFDIQKLQDLSIESVADKLNLTVRAHKAICPFHDDTHASLTFNVHKNRYRCFVCDAHGCTIDLVMNTEGWSFTESCMWLANEFGIVLTNEGGGGHKSLNPHPKLPHPSSLNPQHSTLSPQPEAKPDIPYLERLMAHPILNDEACLFLFGERKISPEVVRMLGISSISYNCPMSSAPRTMYYDGPALLIPYRDVDGKLVSVQSRYLGDSKIQNSKDSTIESLNGKALESLNSLKERPRFRFPKGSTCHVFNLPVLKTLKTDEPLFITEGVTDCMAIMSAGFKAIAIPSATLLKREDIDLIRSMLIARSSSLHMYPDNDEPGERLYFQLKELLPQLKRQQLPVGFKDVGQYWAAIQKNQRPQLKRIMR